MHSKTKYILTLAVTAICLTVAQPPVDAKPAKTSIKQPSKALLAEVQLLSSRAVKLATEGSLEQAEQNANFAVESLRASGQRSTRELAFCLDSLSRVLLIKGDLEKAEEAANSAWTIRNELFGSRHPEVAESLVSCGNVFLSKKDYNRAQDCFAHSLSIGRSLTAAKNTVAPSYFGLAFAELGKGDIQASRRDFESGLSFLQAEDRGRSPRLKAYQDMYVDQLWATSHWQEALELRTNDFPSLKKAPRVLDNYGKMLACSTSGLTDPNEGPYKLQDLMVVLVTALLLIATILFWLVGPGSAGFLWSKPCLKEKKERERPRSGGGGQIIDRGPKVTAYWTDREEGPRQRALKPQPDARPNWGKTKTK